MTEKLSLEKFLEPLNKSWASLHNHFFSSYLDGAIRVKDIKHLSQKGCTAIAMTDHGNLSGTYEFYKECREQKIKPIIGIESYWAFDRKLRAGDELGNSRPNYHMLMYALSNKGLKNLNRINSASWKEGFYFSPRADNALIASYCEDIAATSACLGSITSQYILKGEVDKAKYWLSYFKELFHDNFFVELQPHETLEEQKVVNAALLKLASEVRLPVIVTGDSHYLDCCDSQTHDFLLALSMRKSLDDPDRLRFTWNASIPSYQDLVQRCRTCSIPEEAIENTNYLASIVEDDYFSDRKNRWPSFKKLPEGYKNTCDFLLDLCYDGYKEKYKSEPNKEHVDRVLEEVRVLKTMGYIDYMLILWDILKYARSNSVLVGMGRGSVGGSFVAYLLGITEVDPLKYDLLFSRFCNEGRAATPILFDGIDMTALLGD